MAVKAVPENFATVSGYVIVKDAEKAIDFYAKAFGADAGYCMKAPDGSVMHGEVRIGDSTVMLTQENPQWNARSAEALGGSPVSLHIYTADCDALYRRAIDAGCTEEAPLMDAFWGDRYGKVKDPFGISWGIATHKEDLTPEQIAERAKEWFAQMGS